MKIFVTLGTQDKAFDRLIAEAKKIKGHDIFIQNGYTRCDGIDHLDYMDQNAFIKHIEEADIVITHGGVGSILSALKKHKKVIACARLKKYHEHTNDHQLEIVTKFKDEGYILALNEDDDINELIEKAIHFIPKEYIDHQSDFIQKLDDYISTL